MRLAPLVVIPALLLAAACGTEKKAPPTPEAGATTGAGQLPPGHPPLGQLPPGHPPMGGGAPDAATAGGAPVTAEAPAGSPITWQAPEGWTPARPTNAMRIANFTVGEAAGTPVEVVVFGGIGGTAEQNVERWRGMFEFADGEAADTAADVRKIDVHGMQVTRLDVTGKYGGGMGAGAGHGGENYRMLAVVVDGAPGPVQVRFVGPADIVGEHAQAFDAFIASFQPAK